MSSAARWQAAQAVESDLDGKLRFRLDEGELGFVDRLLTPNEPATYEAVVAEIRPMLNDLYGRDSYTLTQASDDPRRTLTILLRANPAPSLSTLFAACKRAAGQGRRQQ